jgi:protein-S-isoprenylcysteine O-methyltransferase Ste14
VSATGRGPGVDVPPPLLFVAAYVVAWLLDRNVARLWPTMSPQWSYRLEVVGWALVIAGLALGYWGVFTFLRRRTPIYPNRDAKLLVIEGPYRFSRNPMYTGIIIACIGGCGVIESLWPLVTVGIAVLVLDRWVIRREERHLTDEFGEQYREYQRHVGRWFTV